MDLSCIISSGDLELYVLGLLPEEEAGKVAQLAMLFPEIRAELDNISLSLEQLADRAEATPDPAVKTRLMAQLKSLKAQEFSVATAIPPTVEATTLPTEPASVKTMYAIRSTKRYFIAATFIGLLISVGVIIYLVQQNREKNNELNTLVQRNQALQEENTNQQQHLQAYNQALALWQSNEFRKITLTSLPGKPEARVQVFWNPQSHEVYLSDVSLPPAPAGSQYQLWAIVESKPVDAGLVSHERIASQKMKTFQSADAFAITLEKEGGSETPTLEAMFVMAEF